MIGNHRRKSFLISLPLLSLHLNNISRIARPLLQGSISFDVSWSLKCRLEASSPLYVEVVSTLRVPMLGNTASEVAGTAGEKAPGPICLGSEERLNITHIFGSHHRATYRPEAFFRRRLEQWTDQLRASPWQIRCV